MVELLEPADVRQDVVVLRAFAKVDARLVRERRIGDLAAECRD